MGGSTLTPGNVIDFEYIKQDLREFSTMFNVREVAYDPWQATQLATEMLAEGAPMVEVSNNVKNFSAPMKELEGLVYARRLRHNGDPVLAWMVSNDVARLDAKDNIYPRKDLPENKIDGVVAVIMGLARLTVQRDDGRFDAVLREPLRSWSESTLQGPPPVPANLDVPDPPDAPVYDASKWSRLFNGVGMWIGRLLNPDRRFATDRRRVEHHAAKR